MLVSVAVEFVLKGVDPVGDLRQELFKRFGAGHSCGG